MHHAGGGAGPACQGSACCADPLPLPSPLMTVMACRLLGAVLRASRHGMGQHKGQGRPAGRRGVRSLYLRKLGFLGWHVVAVKPVPKIVDGVAPAKNPCFCLGAQELTV